MLTHIQIASAKPAEKPFKLYDDKGLHLLVRPNGSKLWRMRYRFLDKQKELHIGPWPQVGIAEARTRRDDARARIATGTDPAVEKKRARIAAKFAAANTFKEVAEEWLLKCEREGLASVTLDKIRWLLAKAYPVIGSLPISQITPHEALAVLRKVEATGRYESARRMRSVLSRVFRYGVATIRCDTDVAADLRGAIATPKVKHFAAITGPAEVGALIRAIDGYTGQAVTRMAMRLSPHVLLRPGELRQAEWSDIDVERAIWSVPATRMKMRRPHRVPLSRQVLVMIEELREITGHRQHMFPCMGKPRKAMSENAVNQADRTVDAVARANGGRYSVDLHLRHDPGAGEAFATSYVRRLEAMRRAGAGPERQADGSWTIPGDHLARAEAFAQRQQRDRPVALSILSSRQVGDLAAIEAPTWLDRELAAGAAEPVRDAGFGREVRTALAARRQWLIEQQLASGEGRAFRLRGGALDELGRRELRDAGARLSQQVGKPFMPARNGERIEGVIARRVDLESGGYALVERSRDFSLVPWREVLERHIGKTASGIMRADGISWQFGRGRPGPTIS